MSRITFYVDDDPDGFFGGVTTEGSSTYLAYHRSQLYNHDYNQLLILTLHPDGRADTWMFNIVGKWSISSDLRSMGLPRGLKLTWKNITDVGIPEFASYFPGIALINLTYFYSFKQFLKCISDYGG